MLKTLQPIELTWKCAINLVNPVTAVTQFVIHTLSDVWFCAEVCTLHDLSRCAVYKICKYYSPAGFVEHSISDNCAQMKITTAFIALYSMSSPHALQYYSQIISQLYMSTIITQM